MLFIPCRRQIFDQVGYRFDLDFGIQIFEQVGVLIFVRLRWYGVTGTPKRTNIGIQDSLGLVSRFPYMGRKLPKIRPARCDRCARLSTLKNSALI